jgi:tetratricopeptide (TPR) repeat protein
LFFLVTLAPALGFVNVFPFRYSFVADHFQYLAGLGVMVAAASGLLMLARRLRSGISPVVVAVVIALPLGAMTYAQSREYASAETQYRATLAKNPWSSLARNNLAQLLLDGPESGWAEGITHATTVLGFKPDDPVARNLYGLALQKSGRFEQSIPEFREAIRLRPSSWQPHYNLGLSLYNAGRAAEAVQAYEASLAIHPEYGQGWNNYGTALLRLQRGAEARAAFEKADRLLPGSPIVLTNLSAALEATGNISGALATVERALAVTPAGQSATLHNRAGLLSLQLGRRADAVGHFQAALQARPGLCRGAREPGTRAKVAQRDGRLVGSAEHLMSVIGKSIHITGEVRSTSALTIEGDVTGPVLCEGASVTLAATATIDGDVVGSEITVFGRSSGQAHRHRRRGCPSPAPPSMAPSSRRASSCTTGAWSMAWSIPNAWMRP